MKQVLINRKWYRLAAIYEKVVLVTDLDTGMAQRIVKKAVMGYRLV